MSAYAIAHRGARHERSSARIGEPVFNLVERQPRLGVTDARGRQIARKLSEPAPRDIVDSNATTEE